MALLAGATNGPLDMSVSVTLFGTEAALFSAALPALAHCEPLRARLIAAQAQAESQGQIRLTLLLTQLEQGLLMGALANVSCQFSGGLRLRLQNVVTAKLYALGARAEDL